MSTRRRRTRWCWLAFLLGAGLAASASTPATATDFTREVQYWRGGHGDNTWAGAFPVWSLQEDYGNTPPAGRTTLSVTGGRGVFEAGGYGEVRVAGARNFDTLIIEGDYTFIANTEPDPSSWEFVLALSPHPLATGGSFINVAAGATASIGVAIRDGTDNRLTVDGAGHLILQFADNRFTGDLTLGDSVTLTANHAGGLGRGGRIVFDDAAAPTARRLLRLDFLESGTVSQTITGNGDVELAGGKVVTFAGAGNDYTGETRITGGTTLRATASNALSATSRHLLSGGGILDMADTAQQVTELSGTAGTRLTLGQSGRLDILTARDGAGFAGGMSGGAGALLAVSVSSAGTYFLDNLDTSAAGYRGFLAAASGTLDVRGAAGKDLAINLDLGETGTGASYRFAAPGGITLAGRGGGAFDTVEITSGRLALDDGAAAVLRNGTLFLNSPAASAATAGAVVLGDVRMDGAGLIIGGGGGGMGGITATSMALSGNNLVYVDFAALMQSAGGDWYGWSQGASAALISAGSLTLNPGADLTVLDYGTGQGLGAGMTETVRSASGEAVGTARFTAGERLDTGAGTLDLDYRLEELTVAPGKTVELDASASAGPTATMAAKLSGSGTFRFSGDKDVAIVPLSGVGPGQDFSGNVEVAVNPARSLLLGVEEALGAVKRVRVESGELDLGLFSQKFGELAGTGQAALDLGTGGTLTLNGDGNDGEAVFAGRVYGDKDIVKTGAGTQRLTHDGNNIGGEVLVAGGTLALAGRAGGVTARNNGTVLETVGNAVRLDSGVAVSDGAVWRNTANRVDLGGLSVTGGRAENKGGTVRVDNPGTAAVVKDSVLEGGYHITGDLRAENATFVMGAEKNAAGDLEFDQVAVGGTADLHGDIGFALADGGYRLFARDAEAALDQSLLTAGAMTGSIDFDADIILDAGIFGQAGVALRDDGAGGKEWAVAWVDAQTEYENEMIRAWAERGVDLSGPLKHSNLGQVVADTFLDPTNDSVNTLADAQTRFAGKPDHQAAFESSRYLLFGKGMERDSILTGREALALGHSLSGTGEKLATEAGLSASHAMADALLRRARHIVMTRSYGGDVCSDSGWAAVPAEAVTARQVWAAGLGLWEDMEDRAGWDAGYEYSAGGFVVGVDHIAGPFTAGAAVSYLDGDFTNKTALGNDSGVDAHSFGAYGNWRHDSGFNVTGYAGYTWLDNDLRERGAVVHNDRALYGWNATDYDARAWLAGLELAYCQRVLGERVLLMPSVGFRYLDMAVSGHNRRFTSDGGEVVWDGRVARASGYSARVPLGLSAGWDVFRRSYGQLTLLADLEYAYEFNPDGIDGEIAWSGLAGPVRYRGGMLGRHIWNAGGAVKYVADRYDLSLAYRYLSRSAFRSHQFQASVGMTF